VRYLLDTSVILGHVYGDRRTSSLLGRLGDMGAEFVTTDVVIVECLSRGTEAERHVIARLLESLSYVPSTPELALEAAELQRTQGLGLAESLLAAAAKVADAVLLRLPVPGSA
jgi:predicted nucleic acid-binding protein